MSEDSRISIEKIINGWKSQYGVWRTSERGESYKVIGNNIVEKLRILAKTMMDHGYSFDEIDSPRVSAKIADICWREEKITKMSASEISRAKKGLANDWNEVVSDPEFSGIKFSQVEEKKEHIVNAIVPTRQFPKDQPEKEYTKEELLAEALDPKNRLISTKKIDRSNDENLEFLEELGLKPDWSDNE